LTLRQLIGASTGTRPGIPGTDTAVPRFVADQVINKPTSTGRVNAVLEVFRIPG
jgi:hypothetical protein